MECSRAREALSATLDGEDPGVEAAVVDAHLASCAACTAWREEARRLDRLAQIAPVPAHDPGLPHRVLVHTRLPRRRRWRVSVAVAVALAVVGVAQMFIGSTSLFMPLGMGHGLMASAHMDHESAAFDLAFGAAMLVVSLNARRARAFLPMLIVFVGVLGIASVFDLVDAQVDLFRLATHLPIVAGLALTAALSAMTRRDPGPGHLAEPGGASSPVEPAATPDDPAVTPETGHGLGDPPAARRHVA